MAQKHISKDKKIIIGNWKMNPASQKDAEKLFNQISKLLAKKKIKNTEIVICAPSVYIGPLRSASKGAKKIALGGQNLFYEEVGAYTGEISGAMIAQLGAKYVIVGHSERRAMGEDNDLVNKKVKAALSAELIPVLCVGEIERDESHSYFALVKEQLEECLAGISKNLVSKIIIAYEPVWSISSTPNRRDATPQDSLEMVIFIKKILSDRFGQKIDMPRIIYGGSVNDKDAEEFLMHGGVDGVLPGRASLDAEKFAKIVIAAENAIN